MADVHTVAPTSYKRSAPNVYDTPCLKLLVRERALFPIVTLFQMTQVVVFCSKNQ